MACQTVSSEGEYHKEKENEDNLDIYQGNGCNLEDLILHHAKHVHHITKHTEESEESEDENEDNEDPQQQKDDKKECLRCNNLATAYNVDMSLLKIKHAKPKYRSEPWKPDSPITLQLFESEYLNDMSTKQKFSFKAERRTTSVASVELKDPVYYGAEGCKLAVRLPEEIKIYSTVFGKELHPTKGKEEFKEEIIWSVDNSIECPPMKTTKAYLMLKEHRYASKFTVQTAVKGRVNVAIYEENINRPQHVMLDIADVIRKHNKESSNNSNKPEVKFEVDKEKVRYTTEGRCKFVFGVEQFTRVETVEGGQDSCCLIM